MKENSSNAGGHISSYLAAMYMQVVPGWQGGKSRSLFAIERGNALTKVLNKQAYKSLSDRYLGIAPRPIFFSPNESEWSAKLSYWQIYFKTLKRGDCPIHKVSHR